MTVEEKMISMVDFDSFMEAVKVTIGSKQVEIKEEYVHRYLEKWAEAKRGLFVAFGEKLFLEEGMKFSVTNDVMSGMIVELFKKWSKYAAIQSYIPVEDFVCNKVSSLLSAGRFGSMFPKIFVEGKKLSKALSELFDDYDFDVDLSVILQNREVEGFARVSIHPLDYLTISTSGHGWRTCMEITGNSGGFNKSGCYSLMLDKTTIVASTYQKNYIIQNDGGRFEWINKTNRNLYFITEKRDSLYCGHSIGNIDKKVRTLWEKMILDHVAPGKKYDNFGSGYVNKGGSFYYDSYCPYFLSECWGKKSVPTIGVEKLWCVSCGKPFSNIIDRKGYIVHKTEVKGGEFKG